MSVNCTRRVWLSSSSKGSALLVLLAIADHADDNGFAFPGIELLAKLTRLSRRSVIDNLQRLEADGEILINRVLGLHHCYIVLAGIDTEMQQAAIDAMMAKRGTRAEFAPVPVQKPARANYAPVNPSSPVPVNPSSPVPVNPSSPDPSIDPSIDPPKKEASPMVPKPPTPQQAMFQALCDVYRRPISELSSQQKSAIGKVAKALVKKKCDPSRIQELKEFIDRRAYFQQWKKKPTMFILPEYYNEFEEKSRPVFVQVPTFDVAAWVEEAWKIADREGPRLLAEADS